MKIINSLVVLLFVTFGIAQSNNDNVKSNPYITLEYLIGTWELNFGQGTAYMTFEWGPNRTYMRTKSMVN